MKKTFLWIIAIVIVLGIGAGAGRADSGSKEDPQPAGAAQDEPDRSPDIGTLAAQNEPAPETIPLLSDQQESLGGNAPDAEQQTMEVHFIDVGQGDATLIKCGNASMLIDAGDDTKGTAIQNYLQKQGIEKLDYLILTHPDADHIGGAPVIITKFDIDKVFISNYEKDNKTYLKLIQALDDKRLTYETPIVGSEYHLSSASFTILGPNKQYSDPNNSSIALLLQNGQNRFLFTGDAEEAAEGDIIDTGLNIQADVYQAGHHGSRTASSIPLLDAVDPEYVVISCAEGNSYGHPHAEVLNNLRSRGIQLFRTDEQGSVIAESDGKKITWNCAPTDSWKAGEPTGSQAKTEVNFSQEETAEINTGEQQLTQEGLLPAVSGTAIETEPQTNTLTYVLNVKSKKFHRPTCGSLPTTNRQDSTSSREEIIAQGYEPCKKCNP